MSDIEGTHLERSSLTVAVSGVTGDTEALEEAEDLYIAGSWIERSDMAATKNTLISNTDTE